jgi:hypothetical protein
MDEQEKKEKKEQEEQERAREAGKHCISLNHFIPHITLPIYIYR